MVLWNLHWNAGVNNSAMTMRNIRLTLAYDGANYVGWQVQPNGVSVQSTVESAISRLTGHDSQLLAAGRTDSGVHALGQVANFHSPSAIPAQRMLAGLQSFLPTDIVILKVDDVGPEFHATYSAVRKSYRYLIYSGTCPLPFIHGYALYHHGELDQGRMDTAARVLEGTHDFRCFESHYPNKATSVRTVESCRVSRGSGWSAWSSRVAGERARDDDRFISIEITADGFLYNMVRAISGTLIRVGRGQWSAEDVQRIIRQQDRGQAGETAPAHGLYLVSVEYPDS